MARIARTSLVHPSMTAPAAPRACAAVDSNSPQGPIRAEFEHAKIGISKAEISLMSTAFKF